MLGFVLTGWLRNVIADGRGRRLYPLKLVTEEGEKDFSII